MRNPSGRRAAGSERRVTLEAVEEGRVHGDGNLRSPTHGLFFSLALRTPNLITRVLRHAGMTPSPVSGGGFLSAPSTIVKTRLIINYGPPYSPCEEAHAAFSLNSQVS